MHALRHIPGIGPLVATAIVAAIGNGAAFHKECKFAALEARTSRNVLIVATASKLARIAWAVLSSGQDDRAVKKPVAA